MATRTFTIDEVATLFETEILKAKGEVEAQVKIAEQMTSMLDESDMPDAEDMENSDKETVFVAGYSLGRNKMVTELNSLLRSHLGKGEK